MVVTGKWYVELQIILSKSVDKTHLHSKLLPSLSAEKPVINSTLLQQLGNPYRNRRVFRLLRIASSTSSMRRRRVSALFAEETRNANDRRLPGVKVCQMKLAKKNGSSGTLMAMSIAEIRSNSIRLTISRQASVFRTAKHGRLPACR